VRLTPLDIRGQQFRRVMRGADPEEVDAFLATVAAEFESLLAEVQELRVRSADLAEKLDEYKSMEKALRDTLLTAEKVMGEAKEGAQREAGLILREAEVAAQRAKARIEQGVIDLQRELESLRRVKDAYLTRVRWLLRSHLEMLDGSAQEFAEMDLGPGPEPAPPPPPRARPAAPEPGLGARRSSPEPSPAPAPPREARTWRTEPPPPPIVPTAWTAGRTEADLTEMLRPIGPDGSYAIEPQEPAPPASDEFAQAARRAEQLAAQLRAEVDRHAAPAPPARPPQSGDPGWGTRPRDPGSRP